MAYACICHFFVVNLQRKVETKNGASLDAYQYIFRYRESAGSEYKEIVLPI